MKRSNEQERAARTRSFTSDRATLKGWSQDQLWEASQALEGAPPGTTHVRVAFHPQPIMTAALAEELVRRHGVCLGLLDD